MRQLGSLFVLSGLMALALPSLHAQSVGNVVGSVADSAGAVVPGASVKATDKNNGFTRTTVTAADGVYSLPRLPVGTYTVTANATRLPAIVA